MNIFSKLQPVFIVLGAIIGIIIGKFSPFIQRRSSAFIELFLMIMLFFVFLSVDIKEISKSFRNIRFSISALLINFVSTPLLTFILARVFLSEAVDLQIGFIMLLVTPCTDWYLIFTGLAKGNVTLGSSVLPLNLILQILLLPVFLLLFMGTSVAFDSAVIIKSIVFVLIAPLIISNMVKFIAETLNVQYIVNTLLTKSDHIQFLLLCMAVISMFASQGILLLNNLTIFITLLPPLLLFFIVNFFLSYFTGSILKLSFENIIPLVFTTSARNSPVSLAIATITFPYQPIISLVLVMGPLIELPILAINSFILKKIGNKKRLPPSGADVL